MSNWSARLVAVMSLSLSGIAVQALEREPVMTLDVAQDMSRACVAFAKAKGWRMNIAVVDAGANVIAFSRMDHSFLGSGDIATRKAKFAASFPVSTRYAGELVYGKDGKPGTLPGFVEMPGVVAFAGGLPVMAAGAHVGGIGVSGGSPDEDEQCAAAALDAVKGALK
ncbi:MAG: heme-binding protein [Pseudomonadota bacterium]|nr:heme-binding protein [Pseudomonadota bacterium]